MSTWDRGGGRIWRCGYMVVIAYTCREDCTTRRTDVRPFTLEKGYERLKTRRGIKDARRRSCEGGRGCSRGVSVPPRVATLVSTVSARPCLCPSLGLELCRSRSLFFSWRLKRQRGCKDSHVEAHTRRHAVPQAAHVLAHGVWYVPGSTRHGNGP